MEGISLLTKPKTVGMAVAEGVEDFEVEAVVGTVAEAVVGTVVVVVVVDTVAAVVKEEEGTAAVEVTAAAADMAVNVVMGAAVAAIAMEVPATRGAVRPMGTGGVERDLSMLLSL